MENSLHLGKKIPVLIGARPVRIRETLQAFLAAIPQLEVIGQAADGVSMLRLVRESEPALILLDGGLVEEGEGSLLQNLKTTWPHIQCLLLIDSRSQQQIGLKFGADSILYKGAAGTEFFETIENMLPQSVDSPG